MALTEEHEIWRQGGIGGSDARTIALGTGQEWKKLKREKIEGIRPFFTPQQRLLMDMGSALEPVILAYVTENVTMVHRRGLRRTMKSDPFFRCTLDGLTQLEQPVQCKFHTGDKSLDELTEYYWPQLQHEMLVTAQKSLLFVVGFGHWGRVETELVSQDEQYQLDYMVRAMQFKEYCWGGGALPEGMTDEEPAPEIKANIPRLRDHVWPAGSNEIAPLATQWLANRDAVDAFKEAETGIKKAVPEDCRTATWVKDGVGIKVTVNKANSKSIRTYVERGR